MLEFALRGVNFHLGDCRRTACIAKVFWQVMNSLVDSEDRVNAQRRSLGPPGTILGESVVLLCQFKRVDGQRVELGAHFCSWNLDCYCR
jgi:hypothetical protein